MAEKEKTVWEKLSAPFHPSDVKYRIQALSGNNALLLPYIDSRAVQNRLDQVLGVDGWEDDYTEWQNPVIPMDNATAISGGYRSWWSAGKKQGEHDAAMAADLIHAHYQKGVKCILKCRENKKSDWITKVDVSDNSDIEPVKGGASGALRRAAVKFGVGRYLYDLKDIWVTVVTGNRPDGDGWEWTRHGKVDVYYHKPDLRNFGAGDPGGNNEVIPVTLGQQQNAGESRIAPQGTGQTPGNQNTAPTPTPAPEQGETPSPAITPAEMNDFLARISALIQNNKDSLAIYRQINDQPTSMEKVSKMLGCLFYIALAAFPSGQHVSSIKSVMSNRNFGEMLSTLKSMLSEMESGIYK